MAEFLFLSPARPSENRSKWNTDDIIKTELFQGKIIFISILSHVAQQMIQVKMFRH